MLRKAVKNMSNEQLEVEIARVKSTYEPRTVPFTCPKCKLNFVVGDSQKYFPQCTYCGETTLNV
jgi:hypothetical protein